ncbi:MerR family transcriptional regulator [Stutzerimonas nitrititolerans]|uniref:MerR family transcriptional regulator n=1 Tax=Stutzerimonas nitrititolerans TaxID=2482751 RepID=UPI00289D8AC0|nr:MerR family DNA-binding transcriptional regulator [Stutzerimonas nitrititolerans]
MPRIYSITELAREMEVTTRAIRFYEEQGLLLPERRGQKRLYSQRDRVTLELIMRGKRIGLSLAECKELINMYDPAGGNSMQLSRLLETIDDRRQQLKRQVLDIQKMQAELDVAEQRCRLALAQACGVAHDTNNDNRRVGP